MPPKVKVIVTDPRDMNRVRHALLPLFKGQVQITATKKVPQGAEEVKGKDGGSGG